MLFAHAYIKHMGNATAAAREVFKIESDTYASKKGSEMVRKGKVKELIDEALATQRENHKKFLEQGPYYLHVIAKRLVDIVENDKTPFNDFMRAAESLSRLSGRDISESVTIAKIKADAVRPLSVSDVPQPRSDDNSRKVLFLLSPPPIQKGGVPPPALIEQWREQGVPPDVLERWQKEGLPAAAERIEP